MPFERQFNEPKVLDSAMRAFWAHGYEATSIADLVEATGLQRGSLYAAYSGKRGLFLEALRFYDERYRARFLKRIAKENGPREAIIATFAEAARRKGKSAFPTGCLLVNTALELSPHDPEVQTFVNESLGQVEAFFLENIEKAKVAKTVSTATPSLPTAKALLGLFLGLRVIMRSGGDPSNAQALCDQVDAMLG